jgi:hypothetical protein
MATTINAYLTKSAFGEVELWKNEPVFDDGSWREGDKTEVGSEILDSFLDDFVKRNECVKIQITKR